MIRETVHIGHDNTFTLLFKRGGVPIPFVTNETTEVRLHFSGGQTASSDNGDIDYDDAGQITFKLGHVAPPGVQLPELVVVNPLRPNGEVLASRHGPVQIALHCVG